MTTVVVVDEADEQLREIGEWWRANRQELHRAEASNIAAWRASLAAASHGDGVVIASYDRSTLQQTGEGHFSPIGGYHAARDLVLVLDVARFKYPPHWLPAERLWQAMLGLDPSTGHSRGWISLRRRSWGGALGFTLSCKGDDLKGFARRLFDVVDDLGPTAGIEDLATALAPLAANVDVRGTSSAPHVAALDAARSAVRRFAMFSRVEQAVGAERAEAVTLLLIAIADRLAPARRDELTAVVHEAETDSALAAELANLRARTRIHRRPQRGSGEIAPCKLAVNTALSSCPREARRIFRTVTRAPKELGLRGGFLACGQV